MRPCCVAPGSVSPLSARLIHTIRSTSACDAVPRRAAPRSLPTPSARRRGMISVHFWRDIAGPGLSVRLATPQSLRPPRRLSRERGSTKTAPHRAGCALDASLAAGEGRRLSEHGQGKRSANLRWARLWLAARNQQSRRFSVMYPIAVDARHSAGMKVNRQPARRSASTWERRQPVHPTGDD